MYKITCARYKKKKSHTNYHVYLQTKQPLQHANPAVTVHWAM
jgi:hypothetical protein